MNTTKNFSRRNFLSISGKGCATLALGSLALASCATLPVLRLPVEANSISVPKSAFLESKTVIVRNAKLDWDILLVKNPNEAYSAVEMKCTHHDNPLSANEKGMHCTLHGSRFGLDGKVQIGPAERNLKTYPTTTTDANIIIQINA